MRWCVNNKYTLVFWTLFWVGATSYAEFGNPLRPSGFDGNVIYRAAVQEPGNTTNYLMVGRAWTGSQYQGMISSHLVSGGWQNGSFTRRSGWVPGQQFFDFAGAGYDNLCNAGTYAYDGYIVACRSMKSNGYYDVYLVKVDDSGNLVAAFDTDGIVATGIGGDSTNGHAFIRGITYNPDVNGSHNGVVAVVGSVGTNSSNYRPFIATFDQQTGAAYGSVVKNTAYVGTAVGVVYSTDADAYFVASTENSGTKHMYVDKYTHNVGTPTTIDTASSPWGTALSLTGAGGGAESVPSSIVVNSSRVYVIGANRTTGPTGPWICTVAAVSPTTGSLVSGYGYVGITGGTSDAGASLISHQGASPTADCILNAGVLNGTNLAAVGTAYNTVSGNYDHFAAYLDANGDFNTGFASSGMKVLAAGSADDILNSAIVVSGDLHLGGRSQDAELYNGADLQKFALANGATAPVVTAVTITPSSSTINGTETVSFTVTATYSDTSTASVPTTSLDWASSDAGISVSSGTASASSAVTSTITATAGSIIATESLTAATVAAPPNPTSFEVSDYGTTSLTFTWVSGGGTTSGYRLAYQAGTTAPSDCTSGTNLGNVLTTEVTGLTNAANYSFRLCAYNNNFTPDYSSGATLTDKADLPLDPSSLGATATSSSQINLSWTDGSSNESGFYVERSTDNVSFSQIASVAANATSYSSTGLTQSTLYYYRVRAYNTTGYSGYTSVASATTQAGLSVTAVSPSVGRGGHSTTVTGTLFASGATVTIGGSTCSSPSVVSATTITCTAPTGLSAGDKDVVVTSNSTTATLTGGYHFVTTALVDGNGTNGMNKSTGVDTSEPRVVSFDSKLYVGWEEYTGGVGQIRVKVYNGDDSSPSWSFVDGGGTYGINKDTGKSAYQVQFAVFNSKLYAIWKEANGSWVMNIRVAVYNGNDSSPSWSFVDGNGTSGMNKNNSYNASDGYLAVYDGKLYAAWMEPNGSGVNTIRVKVYNGNDSSPSWTVVDGNNASSGVEYAAYGSQLPRLISFNSKLYLAWEEMNSSYVYSIRAKVYNGNDSSPSWSSIDGNGADGIRKNAWHGCSYARWAIANSTLFLSFNQNDASGGVSQIRVVAYNGNDSSPSFSFVDGDGTTGLNKDTTKAATTADLVAYNGTLYLAWAEGSTANIRLRVYTPGNVAPAWTFVDGNASTGLNKNTSKNARWPSIVYHGSKLYMSWAENASKYQIRALVVN